MHGGLYHPNQFIPRSLGCAPTLLCCHMVGRSASALPPSNRPRNGWSFLGGFRRTRLPQPAARSCAATSSDNSKPSRPLQVHRLSPNPFSIQSSLLYPLTVLYTLSCFCLSRAQPRCSSMGHPPAGGVTAPATSRPAPRPCGVESPSRTARSRRRISKSPSKGSYVSSRHILASIQFQPSILSRRFHARFLTRAMQI